jgi:hypothetical protein
MPCPRSGASCLAASVLAAAPALAAARTPAIAPFFEPNAGQTDPRGRFLLRTAPGTFFFTGSGVALAPPSAPSLGLVFLGADPAARIEGAQPLPGTRRTTSRWTKRATPTWSGRRAR